MRIIFMGTPDFSVPTLEKILETNHEVVAVVTQPDRPKGRGKKLTPPPVKEVALKHGIPVLQPERVKAESFIEELRVYNADLMVVIAFGQILPKAILDMPKLGCINVHGSLLPEYRGAAPIQRAIINGEEKTGVTIMYMDIGCDTGDMILKKEVQITEDDTAGSMHDKLSIVGAEAMMDVIDMADKGPVPREKQDDELATHAAMLQKKDGNINWQSTSSDICNLIRGLNPWPSAYSYLDGKMLKIWKAIPLKEVSGGKYQPGQVIEWDDEGIVVATGDGCIFIKELQLQGRKRMPAKEFLKGYKFDAGDMLGINVE